jgi:hypothetical protein
MRRGRRGREGARAAVSTLWVLAQIYLLANSPGTHISPILYSSSIPAKYCSQKSTER